MKSRLEEELYQIWLKIYSEWKKGNINLQEIHGLYFLAKNKYLKANQGKKKEGSELILKILFLAGRISEEFIEKWQSGNIVPTDKELKLLEEGCNEVLEAFDNHFRKELFEYQKKPYSIHHAEVKEKIKKIRNLLDSYSSNSQI